MGETRKTERVLSTSSPHWYSVVEVRFPSRKADASNSCQNGLGSAHANAAKGVPQPRQVTAAGRAAVATSRRPGSRASGSRPSLSRWLDTQRACCNKYQFGGLARRRDGREIGFPSCGNVANVDARTLVLLDSNNTGGLHVLQQPIFTSIKVFRLNA
jgi:hypothetical protein